MAQPLFPSAIGTQSSSATLLTMKTVVRKTTVTPGPGACTRGGGGGGGTRPWWLALLACGGAYWPLALEPSAMTNRHPYYCGHPHCRGHPPAWVGIQNALSAHGVLP